MTCYRVEVGRTAEKQIGRLEASDRRRVIEAIVGLSADPRPQGCRKLRDLEDVYRIRVGSWRILYSVEDERVVVLVLKVGHRRDVYRM